MQRRTLGVRLGIPAAIICAAAMIGCGAGSESKKTETGAAANSGAAKPGLAATGGPEVAVPDVAGKPLAEAEKLLADGKLTVAVTEENNAAVPRDQVLRQAPAAGSKVPTGAEVTLVVAAVPSPIEVKSYPAGFVPGETTHVVAAGPVFLYYHSPTGAGALGRIVDNNGTQTIDKVYRAGALTAGWTSVVGMKDPSETFFYGYDSKTGAASFVQIDGAGNVIPRMSGKLEAGWTHVVDAEFGSKIFYYNSQTGAAAVGGIEPSGPTIQKSFAPGTIATGWTHVAVQKSFNDTQSQSWVPFLFYNSETGAAAVGRLDDTGNHVTLKSYPAGSFSAGWTHVVGAADKILYYNAQTRAGVTGRLDREGNHTIATTYPPRSFSLGWTHLTGLEGAILFYNARTGAGSLGVLGRKL